MPAFTPTTAITFPSTNPTHRRADLIVHLVGLFAILFAGGALIWIASQRLSSGLISAVVIYVICALFSNLASCAYHFAPLHTGRTLLRRIDHAAIYPSITGTFTPLFILAGTTWTYMLLGLCWALTVFAIWNKLTNVQVKSRWSTASYLGLGALGLCALPDLGNVTLATLWYILAGAMCYVVGVVFYARKTMPYRYATWHFFVNIGGILMFVGIWLALI